MLLLQLFLSLTCSLTTGDQWSFSIASSKFCAAPLVLAPVHGPPFWPIKKEIYVHFFGLSLKSVHTCFNNKWQKLLILQLSDSSLLPLQFSNFRHYGKELEICPGHRHLSRKRNPKNYLFWDYTKTSCWVGRFELISVTLIHVCNPRLQLLVQVTPYFSAVS